VTDGPSVQEDLSEYYESVAPGLVHVIGVDLWNGSPQQVAGFRAQTGVEFPLLLDGSAATGGNMSALYGPYDNYVVVGPDGRVHYRASDCWASLGDRYQLEEIRATVDALLSTPVRERSWGELKGAFAAE